MKNLYFYGTNSVLSCVDTDYDEGFSTRNGVILINNSIKVNYWYENDSWTITIDGEIPSNWIVKCIEANCNPEILRENGYQNTGEFIHIQVPENDVIEFSENEEERENDE